MPAEITVQYVGEPEKEAALRSGLSKAFEKRAGDWKVSILGDQSNTTWVAKVTAPKESTAYVHKFYGEDGGHNVERILEEISRVADGLKEKEKA